MKNFKKTKLRNFNEKKSQNLRFNLNKIKSMFDINL